MPTLDEKDDKCSAGIGTPGFMMFLLMMTVFIGILAIVAAATW